MQPMVMECIGKILPLCTVIINLVAQVKANKESCRCLAGRVGDLKELVESVQQRKLSSPSVSRALQKLSVTLDDAHQLVRKCIHKNILNFLKFKREIDSVNERLSHTFQILSGALLIEQGNMMHRMSKHCNVKEDDIERDRGLGFYGATDSVHCSPAVATMPFSAASACVPFSTAAASMRYTTTSAPVSFSTATTVMPFSTATAVTPFSAAVAPAPFFPNVGALMPFSSATASMYVSTLGVENGTLINREAFFRQTDLGRVSTTTQFNNRPFWSDNTTD